LAHDEHLVREYCEQNEWSREQDTDETPQDGCHSFLHGLLERTGDEDVKACEKFMRDLAKRNGYDGLFELGKTFGILSRGIAAAAYSLHCPDEELFKVRDYLDRSALDLLERQLREYSVAQSLVTLVIQLCNFDFKVDMPNLDRPMDLISDLFAAFWQAFGVVVGEVRRQDEFVLRERSQRRIPREIFLGGEVTDDRIAEAVGNAQELVRDVRGSPAVVVSQLCFAVETCIKRICRKDLAYPGATVLGAIEKCRSSKDDRMK
jgi:hypothetical protein